MCQRFLFVMIRGPVCTWRRFALQLESGGFLCWYRALRGFAGCYNKYRIHPQVHVRVYSPVYATVPVVAGCRFSYCIGGGGFECILIRTYLH